LKMHQWDTNAALQIQLHTMLKNCDAYLATGSNQSISVFKEYFGKYPSLLRNNKTSIAVLTGEESLEELTALADDIYLYFGLGCRNVTKLWVPQNYPFEPLLNAFRKYDELKHHNKYRNNFDYQLALYILNNQLYMSNESLLLIEDKRNFSPISVLHYEFYSSAEQVEQAIQCNDEIQCVVGRNYVPFGQSQQPKLDDFADGLNTVEFLNAL
jgi:hypothetical protein